MTTRETAAVIQCPAAQPGPESVVFGVATGPREARRIGYLNETRPADHSVVALTAPATPAEVLRIAAPCLRSICPHWKRGGCSLVERVVANFDPVVGALPACRIRPRCRWFHQEGAAACVRCPQIVTDTYDSSPLERWVADPDANPMPPEARLPPDRGSGDREPQ